MRPARARRGVRLAAGLGALALAPAALAGGKAEPGAYCPLPADGKPAVCLAPARASYGEFFGALEGSGGAAADPARVEADLVGTGPRRYEALSALAYGYWWLARHAKETPGPDPEVTARLERWNALLSRAYAATPQDDAFRAALHDAALDLRRRAEPVGVACIDAEGRAARCDSTEAVVRAMEEARDRSGVRGTLSRLLRPLFGPPEPPR